MSDTTTTSVAVLDPEGPPGLAFIRSLGARGLEVNAFSPDRWPSGRMSRYVSDVRTSPSAFDTDAYVDWLTEEMREDRIGLVAPTSDYTVYAAALAADRAGRAPGPGMVSLDRLWSVLHKGRFGEHMADIGFPTVEYRLPTSVDDACDAAEELGYPLILKPRSHVGVGLDRGGVVADRQELIEVFRPSTIGDGDSALGRDPDLAWPMLQRYVEAAGSDVVSLSGCLDADGNVMALQQCVKRAQWPPKVGVGALFEAVEAEDLIERAVEAARATIGTGLFELEVCRDGRGGAWPIDLNPRAYGQIALDIARGNDLPALWYGMVTGTELAPLPLRDPAPEVWRSGMTYYPHVMVDLITSGDRRAVLRRAVNDLRRPRVGSMLRRDDPLPAVALAIRMARSPGGLLRPLVKSAIGK